jgi:hypothetical protein
MSNYEKLNGMAKAAAEIIELTARQLVEKRRAHIIPGHKAPPNLVQAIQARYELIDDATKSAVVDLLVGGSMGRMVDWERWLHCHLLAYPQDAVALSILERDFKGATSTGLRTVTQFQMDHFGSGFNWQMDHDRADYELPAELV